MSTDNILVIVRLILHIGGTVATTLGWLAPDQVSELQANILAIVGPIMNTIGLLWTGWSQRPAAKIASTAKLPEVAAMTITDPAAAAAAKAAAPETRITEKPAS